MQRRRSLAGAFGLGLAVLVLAPAAWATLTPVITSITPDEVGSNFPQKFIIHGENFAPGAVVYFAEMRVKHKSTGPCARGESVDKSATEIEFCPAFHEHGKRLVQVCNTELPEACSSSEKTPANTITIVPEIYRNEAALGTAHVTSLGYGEIFLNSPQIETQIECVNVGFGSGWNEAPTGQTNPVSAHGEILVWWASGHTPKAPHTELSSRCRFVFHGVEENQPTSPIAWATAEPPVHNVIQEGIVCTEVTKKLLSECPAEAERSHINVIRETNREGLSLPWNIQFTERSEKPRVRIGLPFICKQESERTELTEGTEPLERCPEASEREASKNPARCNRTPDPPGCVKVDILSNPPLNVHMEYEGYVEPVGINGGPNGLSPSTWTFEGSATGEPTLHLRETPTIEGSTTGSIKIIGFSANELMSSK